MKALTDALDHNEIRRYLSRRNNTEFRKAGLNMWIREGEEQRTTRFGRDSPSRGVIVGSALKSDILFTRQGTV